MKYRKINFINLNESVLLMGSKATNFTFEFNNTDLKFHQVNNILFRNNLILVDGLLPNILGEVIIYAYRNNCFKLSEIVQLIERINPLCFKTVFEIKYYTYKIKEFLRNLALGMNTSNVWNGTPNIYDHFPVMSVENELIYYSDKNFIEVLLERAYVGDNTDEAIIFSEDEKLYIKVKLTIELMTKK